MIYQFSTDVILSSLDRGYEILIVGFLSLIKQFAILYEFMLMKKTTCCILKL